MSTPFRIIKSMTTPTRPGKQPRPVWNTDGDTTGYEDAITAAGGTRYGRAFSFWADPTEALEGAERTSFAERQDAARDRAGDRAERYATYAEHAKQRATDAVRRSDALIEHIPMGQPILVGHHSEKRHRKTLERSRNLMFQSLEEQRKADHWHDRAGAAEQTANPDHTAGFCTRRINECETELRDLERTLAGTSIKYGGGIPEGEWKTRLEHRVTDQRDRLGYWQAELARIGGAIDLAQVKPGDHIQSSHGRWWIVVRVYAKSVTVQTGPVGWGPHGLHGKVTLERITGHRSV